MRILFDNGTPRGVAKALLEHVVELQRLCQRFADFEHRPQFCLRLDTQAQRPRGACVEHFENRGRVRGALARRVRIGYGGMFPSRRRVAGV